MVSQYITIDGKTSQDLDDGFSIAKDNDNWKVDIFIATPALSMKYTDPDVKLAQEKGFTQYKGDVAKDPMLPEQRVMEELSLLPGAVKKVLKVSVTVDSNGDSSLQSVSVVEGENIHKLAYSEVDEVIKQGGPSGEQLSCAVECARTLFYRRLNNNLTILNEEEGAYTDEDGNVQIYSLRDIHGQIIVQEFMIMTNALMTQWAHDKGLPLYFRNHLPLTDADLKTMGQEVYEFYKELDFSELKSSDTHLLGKAKYDTENKGHAGLDLPAYAPFTSPLRRYPDLHNQYVTLSALGYGECPVPTKEQADHINNRAEAMKGKGSEQYKVWAAIGAFKKLRNKQGDKLTTNQFLQVFKRHPKQHAKNLAADHLLQHRALQTNPQVWATLINFPQQMPESLGKKIAKLFISIAGIENAVFDLLCKMTGLDAKSVQTEKDIKAHVRGLLFEAIGLNEGQIERIADGVKDNNVNTDKQTESFNPSENYKGKALEFCMKMKLPEPVIDLENKGAPHLPVWVATSTMPVSGKAVEAKNQSKKKAEQKVYWHFLQEYGQNNATLPVKNKAQITAKVDAPSKGKSLPSGNISNPKGKVLEHFQKLKAKAPEVSLSNVGSDHAPTWVATCEFQQDGQSITVSGESRSKKNAEQEVFLKLIDHLKISDVSMSEDKAEKAVSDGVNTKMLNPNSTQHPKSAVMEFCQANKRVPPEVTSSQKGAQWCVQCRFDIGEKELAFENTAANKKAAEMGMFSDIISSLQKAYSVI